jgi:hypothetical protein
MTAGRKLRRDACSRASHCATLTRASARPATPLRPARSPGARAAALGGDSGRIDGPAAAARGSGKPHTEDGLGQEYAKLVIAIHKAGRLESDSYDLHGLRHTRGVALSLGGCSDDQAAAMIGHRSPTASRSTVVRRTES